MISQTNNSRQTEFQKRYKEEGDFLYGHVSGTQLEEFIVIKMKQKGKPQERQLCIDGFNIYTKEIPKNLKQKGQAQSATTNEGSGNSWLSSFQNKFLGSKNKKKTISSIV